MVSERRRAAADAKFAGVAPVDSLRSGLVPALSTLPFFVAASLALLVIPGPAVLYILARSSSQGRRAGLVSVAGVHAASVAHVIAAVAGLSAIIVASAAAFTGVKIAGGAYLIVLGVRSWRTNGHESRPLAPIARPLRRLFVDGFLVNLFNPKVALFFLAFLPQFVRQGHGPIWSQILALGLLYIVLGLASDSAYALLGARIGRRLSGRRGSLRAGRYAEGGVLIGLGVLTIAVPSHRTA